MLAAAGRAAAVPRLVRDDAQKPRAERLVDAEASERAPGLDEGVLDGVLGVRSIAGDDVSHSECNLLVGTDELLVGASVATLCAQLGRIYRVEARMARRRELRAPAGPLRIGPQPQPGISPAAA